MPTLLGRAVQHLNVRVLGAADGANGLALFHRYSHDIELVLLGRTLPVVSSLSVLAEIQHHNLLLPVVVITGMPPFSIRHEYADYQLAAILQTPFELRAISTLIQHTLNISVVPAIALETSPTRAEAEALIQGDKS